MNAMPLSAIAHPTEVFSDRDPLGKAFAELNSGWPAVVMVEGHPNLLLPADAVGHHEGRRLFDLPLLPAMVLAAETPIRNAFDTIGEEDFIVVRSPEGFGVIARKTILEALIKELDLPWSADAGPDSPLPEIVDELPEGIVVLDEDQRVSFCNRSGRRLLSLLSPARKGERVEQLAGVPLAGLAEDAKQGLPGYLHLGKPAVRVFSVRILCPASDQQVRMILVLRDVTHVRHRQIREATRERMALLGRLASGIAHDFNNMLTVIMAQASLIQMQWEQDASLRRGTATILAAALKSSALVRQLLVFGRRELAHSGALNLQEVLRELEAILQKLVGDGVALELALPADLWPVAVDPAQIERIVANLIVNSRNAMPGGGRIIIQANNEPACGRIAPCPGGEPARAVHISVRDTGRGMNAATLGRAFEPFFTTHDEDGTGLGLATVQYEVSQLGGSIALQSVEGQGTLVEIFLPVSDLPAKPLPISPAVRSAPITGGHILLIEDQEDLRAVVQGILEHAGYAVQAASGRQAILDAFAAGGEPDLLILDGAQTVLPEAHERFPGLRVLILERDPDSVQPDPLEYLAKPFSGIDLLDRVGLLIGAGAED